MTPPRSLGGNHRRRTRWVGVGNLLRKAGFGDFTIFDREDGVGGTWRINTYPGLACDVKSHLYSFSFDKNANWSRFWSGQAEILAYFERCAQRHGLGPHLNSTPRSSRRDGIRSTTWRLTTSTGAEHTFDFVVSAVGLFTRPTMPTLLEEEPFTGTLVHTARWDHTLDLTDNERRRLGTGSTAAQLVPEVVKVARKVYSIQRSPTWILPSPTGNTPGGRSGSSRMCRSPRSSIEPGCGCAASPTFR